MKPDVITGSVDRALELLSYAQIKLVEGMEIALYFVTRANGWSHTNAIYATRVRTSGHMQR